MEIETPATNATNPSLAQRLRELPTLASILALALILCGAGWFAWDQWLSGPTPGKEIDIGSVNAGRGFRMAARPPPVPAKDGVSLLGAGLWHVKSGDFFMNVPVKNAEIRLFYSKNDLLPHDQTALLQSAQIMSGNPEMSKRLNISAEQTKQLNALFSRRGNGLELEPADREKLKSMWEAYNATADSAKKAKEDEVLAGLKQIGAKSLAPTRQQFSDRAQQVKAILTPEQLSQLAR